MLLTSLKSRFLMVLLCLFASKVNAHRYFFAITDINNNQQTQTIEIIHRITAHDIENAIAQTKNIHFSPEHKQYEQYIQSYIEQQFQLRYTNGQLQLKWVGLELDKGDILIFQEGHHADSIIGLTLKNKLLVEHYPAQINTVNYRQGDIEKSISFNSKKTTAQL